ncbi:MAG TPA: TraX family protein [Mobilitalea sp.]|nr:TraX family protein [Mobilitalea sp.]
MSTFVLKMIAVVTMLIDHVAVVFIPNNTWLYLICRIIGRLAFPIYAFLLVEGFFHTRNIKRYLARLGIFALISEVPFDLVFYNKYIHWEHQNIFFTLFLGLLAIYLINTVESKYVAKPVFVNIANALITIVFCFVAALIKADYRVIGILLIVAFYLFRGSKPLLIISMIIISGSLIQAFYTLSLIPIFFYNGKKGRNIKYFFYVFYPAHLLILYLIKLIV